MARKVIGKSPFKVKLVNSDTPLSVGDVVNTLKEGEGITLCVRSLHGHDQRGGYFFHFYRAGNYFQIVDFERKPIDLLDDITLTRLVNHVSGLNFDEHMMAYCQTVINLRKDETTDSTGSLA